MTLNLISQIAADAKENQAMTKTYILRTCAHDMTSHGGFVWPKLGRVVAPDWNPAPECGNGLHGFLMGEGDGRLASWDGSAVWIVAEVEVESVVDLGGKVKFPEANVIFAGSRFEATNLICSLGASGAVIGATATAGDYGTATVGACGTATVGHRGIATAGYCGTATAGYRGTATAGYCGTATAGYCGTATAGEYGTLQIAFFGTRNRIAVAYVGENGILPNVAYRLDSSNQFIKA